MDKYLSDKIKALSFISMILVVFLHANNLIVKIGGDVDFIEKGYNSFIQNFLSEGLTRVAVPLFFMISGYLFFLKIKTGHLDEFVSKYHKRLKTLALPYVLWSLFGLLLFLFLQTNSFSQPFFTKELIRDYTFSKLITTIFYSPIPYQLWFIRDLLILVTFSPIIYWLLRYFKASIISVFFFTWLFEFDYYIFSNEALLFFSIGAFIGIEKINLQKSSIDNKKLLFTLTWLFLVFCKTALVHLGIGENIFILLFHKTSILIGILAVWFLYDFIFKNLDISKAKGYFLFQFTFFLFACHEPVLTILKKGLYFLLGQSEFNSFVIFISAPALTIIIVILTGLFLKRLAPAFYSLITGGR